MELKPAHFQESGLFQELDEDDISGKWAPIFQIDRTLLKMDFILQHQDFVYVLRICGPGYFRVKLKLSDDGVMEVAGENDGALAAGTSVAAMMPLFICIPTRRPSVLLIVEGTVTTYTY